MVVLFNISGPQGGWVLGSFLDFLNLIAATDLSKFRVRMVVVFLSSLFKLFGFGNGLPSFDDHASIQIK